MLALGEGDRLLILEAIGDTPLRERGAELQGREVRTIDADGRSGGRKRVCRGDKEAQVGSYKAEPELVYQIALECVDVVKIRAQCAADNTHNTTDVVSDVVIQPAKHHVLLL